MADAALHAAVLVLLVGSLLVWPSELPIFAFGVALAFAVLSAVGAALGGRR